MLRGGKTKPVSGIVKGGMQAIGESPKIATAPGRFARQISDISKGDVERTRALTGKHGSKFVFSGAKQQPEFIGKEITPRVVKIEDSAIENMEPGALRRIGVKPEVIDDMKAVKKEFGLAKLPSSKEAEEFFENVIAQADDSFSMIPEGFEKAVKGTVAELSKGLGRENPLVRQFEGMLADLEQSPSPSQAIMQGAGRQKVKLNKETYLGTRRALNSMFTGRDEIDRFVQGAKAALDKDAAAAGITGMGRARAVYRVSKEADKIRAYLANPEKRSQNISTLL